MNMKYSFSIKCLSYLTLLLFLNSCDLALQESYEFDDDATIYNPSPPFDMTIWEFMTQESDFELMVEAVKLAGLEGVFNDGQDDKTVLLLRQDAMTKFLEDQGAAAVADVPVEIWQHFLQYHVITTRFTQNDLNSQEYTIFQTLYPGDDGRIVLWKWRRYMELQINRNGSPDRPSTAKGQSVFLHNYEFTNGVGHQLQGYVGWAAY